MIEPLPVSTDKEYWGDGFSSRTEMTKSEHKHTLIMRNRGLECECGWRLQISDPITAEKVMNKINNS